MFLAPFFTILSAMALVGDSDNLVFGAVTEGVLITAAIFSCSKRVLAKHKRKAP
jgi:hypothetical protein